VASLQRSAIGFERPYRVRRQFTVRSSRFQVYVFQKPSEPPQFSQHGQICLRHDALSQNSSPDILGHREMGYFRLFRDFQPIFFRHPEANSDVSFALLLSVHDSPLYSSLLWIMAMAAKMGYI
jgi:hypothetical protein